MNKIVGCLFAVGGIAALIFISDKKRSIKMKMKMNDEVVAINKAFSEEVATVRNSEFLTAAERRELTERFKGMSVAEVKVWMELVPVEYCIERIQNELNKAAELKRSINDITTNLK